MLSSFERVTEVTERKRLHCIACKRLTIHNLEVRCKGTWTDERNFATGGEDYSIFRCGACDEVCYETAAWDNQITEFDEDGPYCPRFTTQYPAPISSHFNFNTESTPQELNNILDEMLYSMAGSKLMLATIGLRLAVEFIVKDQKCKGANLKQKIESLHAASHVDADQRDVLQRIREKGNAGAHEAKGMNSREMVAGMAIIEGLLEKFYNGPARHAKTIRQAKRLFPQTDPANDEAA